MSTYSQCSSRWNEKRTRSVSNEGRETRHEGRSTRDEGRFTMDEERRMMDEASPVLTSEVSGRLSSLVRGSDHLSSILNERREATDVTERSRDLIS